MTGMQCEKSALAGLVLFMVCLGIAGGLAAGAHYVVVDLPAQQDPVHPPANIAAEIEQGGDPGGDPTTGNG